MKTKQNSGRTALVLSISMAPKEIKFVEKRVLELKPRVANRSNYFQRLAELDRQYHLIRC